MNMEHAGMHIELVLDRIETAKNMLLNRLCYNCLHRGVGMYEGATGNPYGRFSCQVLIRKAIEQAGFDPDILLLTEYSCGSWEAE